MTDRLPILPDYDAPPLDNQLVDLLLFATPDMWRNEMEKLNEQIMDHIEQFGRDVQRTIQGLEEWQAAIIGGAIGLGGGILGGIAGAAAGALLLGEVKKWLNGKLGEILDAVWEAHRQLVDAMQACLDALFGNPDKLKGLGVGYQTAKSSLGDASFAVTQATDTVGIFWEGRGHEAYSGAAGQQTAAMDVIGSKMTSASHLMADAAEMIQKCWSDIMQAVIALAADITSTLVGDVDITKLPTYPVTATTGVIVDAVNFLNAVITAVRKVSIQGRNTGFMAWAELSGGDAALDNSRWPKPDGLASNQYSNDDNWSTTDT